MNHITIVAAHYNQPRMMAEWWANLRAYEDDVCEHVSLIMCDDGSKEYPLVIPDDIRRTFDVRHYRALEDKPWNEMGCRNLCMQRAKGWCFMTDPDYLLVNSEMKKLLNRELERKHYYHLNSRLSTDHQKLTRPENIAVVHTEDFWAAGGYDELFSGGYGYSDCLLFKCLKDGVKAQDTHFMDIWMDHYSVGDFPSQHGNAPITDACSPGIRDVKRNKPMFGEVTTFIRLNTIDLYICHSKTRTITFEWEEVL